MLESAASAHALEQETTPPRPSPAERSLTKQTGGDHARLLRAGIRVRCCIRGRRNERARSRRSMRKSFFAASAGHDDHDCGSRARQHVHSARRDGAVRHCGLPRGRIDKTNQRLEHPVRSLDAHGRLERQVPLRRRRRICRRDQLWRHRRRAAARICRRINRYRARRWHRRFRAGPSRAGDRLRVSRQASAGCALEGHHPRLLWPSCPALVLPVRAPTVAGRR